MVEVYNNDITVPGLCMLTNVYPVVCCVQLSNNLVLLLSILNVKEQIMAFTVQGNVTSWWNLEKHLGKQESDQN